MRALVTGGAGYVGSVVVEELIAAGAEAVVVLDDLSKGHAGAVQPPATLLRGDIGDRGLVLDLCRDHGIDVVVHMAAASLVGESVEEPAKYYDVNLTRSLALLDSLRAAGVDRFVLSSTAAVYGEPEATPIVEDAPLRPTNPYGETKLALEQALGWYAAAYGLRVASLRYFNAAGATARNGEQHDPETHLIPIVLDVALGKRPAVTIFGEDYPTPDGTCIRDYVHVSDLARAHVLAIEAMGAPGIEVYNLGNGDGFSVREVIETARAVTGSAIATSPGARRQGDPAVLVASSERARQVLGWRPRKPGLDTIIGDAWQWMTARR